MLETVDLVLVSYTKMCQFHLDGRLKKNVNDFYKSLSLIYLSIVYK